MAFWTNAAASQPGSRPAAGPAKPVTVVLHVPAGDFNTLVRLKIKAPSAPAVSDDDEDEEAAHAAAGAAMSKLHSLIMNIESKSADARKHSITEVLSPQDMQLQMLCQKAVAPKLYKSLMPQQTPLSFSLGDVKSCISLAPLGMWELHEALQTAVIKSLTGNSCGTCSSSSTSSAGAAASTHAGSTADGGAAAAAPVVAGPASAAAAATEWMCLSRYKLVGCNLLSSQPGQPGSAAVVQCEAKGQPPNKVLLLVKSAGMVKFRLFSPMQALSAEPTAIQPPLLQSDSDADLLADRSKLAAAARRLDGRAVKLLPDERQAFIKSLQLCPSSPSALKQLSDYWLGHYGLQLPTFPFLVGVASDPEAESASLEVPSCCVLTNLGLSVLPGSSPGGSSYRTGMQQLLQGLQGSQLQLLGAEGFKVEANPAAVAGVTGISDALMQIGSQAGNKPAAAAAAGSSSNEAGPLQPKHFSLAANWTTAKDVSKLQDAAKAEAAKAAAAAGASKQAAAGATKGQQQQKAGKQAQALPAITTTAAAQLLGLQEVTDPAMFAAAGGSSSNDSSGIGGERQRPVLGANRSGKDYSKLQEYVLAKQLEQQEQRRQLAPKIPGAAAGVGTAAGGTDKPSSSSSGSGSGSGLLGKPPALAAAAAAAKAGPPGVPKFGARKPGLSAAAAAAGKPAAKKPPAGASASLIAAVKAAAADKEAAAADKEAAAEAAVAAAGMKRPAAGAAVAAGSKPPAAKKAKPADATAAGKPKPAAKKKAAAAATPAVVAAAAATGVGTGDAAGGAAAGAAVDAAVDAAAAGSNSAAAAAAAAAPERKRTKASDLDLAAVTAKVLAAYAAGGGSSLKGVSVPEMQCYLRSQGQRGGPTKKVEVEARLLALLATTQPK